MSTFLRSTLLALFVTSLLALAGQAAAQAQPENGERPDGSGATWSFGGTGMGAIPDGGASPYPNYGPPLVITFNVFGDIGRAFDFAVALTLTHTYIGDLDVVLTAPGGSPSLPLFSRVGATTATGIGEDSDLDGMYLFTDSVTTNIWTAATNAGFIVPVGSYSPTAPGGAGQVNPAPLTSLKATFDGLVPAQVNGNWTLTIRDGAQDDTGSVTRAFLKILAVKGKADFNSDGLSDIIYRSALDGAQNKVWLMNGVTRISEAPIVPDAASADWLIRGADDFDSAASPGSGKDGKTDLVFWNQTTGAVEFWLMDGVTRVGAPVPLTGGATLPTNWDLSATADFNGDGKPDLVWRNNTSQNIVVWTMNGTTKLPTNLIPSPAKAVDANWIIVAADDYNRDYSTDFLWYNVTSGNVVTWYMNGVVRRISGQFTSPTAAADANWKAVASADYSRLDAVSTPPVGTPDIIWRNATSGNQVIWHMDSASTRLHGQFTTPAANTPATDWVIVGPR